MRMNRTELRTWAKGMILEQLDKYLDEYHQDEDRDPDDQETLLKQRNRVAKMFGLKKRTHMYPPLRTSR